MKKVLITQILIKQYRAPFFEQLYRELQQENIQLKVTYGIPTEAELKKADNVELSPEVGIKVKNYWFFGNKLLYQPVFEQIFSSDLIIVEQANKHLINYLLLLFSTFKIKKVAFWGHGRNRQAETPGFSEWVKQQLLTRVNWWFIYTEGTKKYLQNNKVPPEIITVVQNSIDTEQFRSDLSQIGDKDLQLARENLGWQENDRIGLFCGGLYPEKKIGVLIESARLVKAKIPNFKLVVIGGGLESDIIKEAASKEPWIYYLGSKFGLEKALYFKLADLFLMPGLVGLAILDAFTAGLPLITTDLPIHSPEIDYLDNNINGIITQHDCDAYARAVVDVLTDQNLLLKLREGTINSSKQHTMSAMVNNFKTGVMKCLEK